MPSDAPNSPSPRPDPDSPPPAEEEPDAQNDSGDEGAKQPEASSSATPAPEPAAAAAAEWQAVWSPAHNAYYFFNTRTQETTWINPLQPPPPADTASSAALVPAAAAPEPELPVASTSAQPHDPYAAAIAAGIDPELAHLDPTLALPPIAGGPAGYVAKFNARTGAFAKSDARTPDHLSEFERARRMSEMYFDVNQWEQEVAERKEQERQDELNGKKRKRPSKKDLVSPSPPLCAILVPLTPRV